MDPLPNQDDQTDLVTAILGGAVAGSVQTILTYPFEYMKTTSQIENNTIMKKAPVLPMNVKPLFIGCGTLAMGNALKASSRFLLFNSMSDFMANDNGKTTAPRVVVAGLMTGALETLWVIPFENIKTRMIENSMYLQGMKVELPKYARNELETSTSTNNKKTSTAKTTKRPTSSHSHGTSNVESVNPRTQAIEYYRKNPSVTFSKVVKEIYATQGFRGFKQGSLITIFRQCMNSMVWFSSYNTFQQMIDPTRDSLTELELLAMGFASSCAVVATTQPIDVIKTRMQTKDYRLVYRDIMTCTVKMFMEEGAKKLWSGWFPRLVKVSFSGSVTLFTYNAVTKGMKQMSDIKPFSAE